MKKKTFVYQVEVWARPSEEKEDAFALELLEQVLEDATFYLHQQINEIEDYSLKSLSVTELKQIQYLNKMIDKYNEIKESIKLVEVKE